MKSGLLISCKIIKVMNITCTRRMIKYIYSCILLQRDRSCVALNIFKINEDKTNIIVDKLFRKYEINEC